MSRSRRKGSLKIRLMIAAGIAIFALFKYCAKADFNEITGETQYVSLNQEQEIALGYQSVPRMIQQYGGLYQDDALQNKIDKIGKYLVENSPAATSGYKFDFHLLADEKTVNAFALPGGPVFITYALYKRLENDDQLAGVLGHEIAHVLARHSSERIAKMELTEGLTGAAVAAAGDYNTAQAAALIGNVVNMKYGRDQELESDDLGIRFMLSSGYKPEEMIGVMEILDEASSGNAPAEFMSTHPSPENRIEKIKASIEKYRS
ncbi:MAG: M48 family metalloprotease [Flavobacteriales bacterium]|nr:M48 family metalloprotease [Flavobacteriales bacterium]